MTSKTDQSALMTRYLLGEAKEDEQARLEEQFFADDEQYQQLNALEDELRYEYARGGLSAKQRRSFESRFMNSVEDRRKVDLAKTVLKKVHESHSAVAALAPKESTSWRESLTNFFTVKQLSFASAALLVVLSAGSLMMMRMLKLRDQVQQLQAQKTQIDQDAQRQLATGRRQMDQLSQELESERNRGKNPAKTSQGIVGFVLMPGLVRDADGMKRLVIPAGGGDVTLQLEVKRRGEFKSYRAELQNLDGAVLWSQNLAQPSLAVPARLLTPGDYVVMLKGLSANDDLRDAGEFYFQIVAR
jgi:hypothetical protein